MEREIVHVHHGLDVLAIRWRLRQREASIHFLKYFPASSRACITAPLARIAPGIHAEVVQAAEEAFVETVPTRIAVRSASPLVLDDHLRQQGSKRRFFDDALPAILVRAVLGVGKGLDGMMPGAGIYAVIGACQIRFGDLQVQRRLPED